MKYPISSTAGIVVIVLFCAFTFTSWGLYPESYSPLNNWLSDLGNSAYSPRGAIYFNVGCILAGVALFPFFFGLYKWHTENRWREILLLVAQIVGVLAAFALIMIGIFSEDFGGMHHLWSSVFFLLDLGVLVLLSSALFTHPKYNRGVAYYGLTVAAVNVFLLVFITPSLEWLTVFTGLGYVGLLAFNMLKVNS